MMKMLFLFFFLLVKVHDFYLNVYIVYLLNVYREKSCGELIMSWLINIKNIHTMSCIHLNNIMLYKAIKGKTKESILHSPI